MTFKSKHPTSLVRALLVTAGMLATGAATAAESLKIGLLSTLSGPGAPLGNDIRDGFQLALKLNGDKLGGLATEVIVADDGASPDTGRQLADRLVKRDKVDFMTGIVFSNVMLAAGPPTFAAKTFYISANAGPSQLAGEQCNPYFFSVSWQNDNLHEAVGKQVADKGFKKVALIAPNYPGGKDAISGFRRLYKGEPAVEIYTTLNQLDYGAELSRLRAAKPDAVYFFLPGGMGINFVKQFAGAGLNKEMALFGPGFSTDEDVIRAVGEPMLGIYNSSHWAHDLDNPANKKFVAEFEKAYGRLPSLYASQGYDAALLIDAAVRQVKGNLADKAALHGALAAAKFDSVRGPFKFNSNQFPVQDYFARLIEKDAKGRVTNKNLGPVLKAHADAYAGQCKLPAL
jgi:branched-chain amino acid transport system substrate-binding protein